MENTTEQTTTTLYKYETEHGFAKWSQELKPRQKSGFVGQMTVNCQFTISELAQLQKKYPNATSKRRLQDAVKNAFGIVATETNKPKTDTTVLNVDEWIKNFKTAITKTIKKREVSGQKQIDAIEVKEQIYKVVPESLREAVYKEICPIAYKEEQNQKTEIPEINFL